MTFPEFITALRGPALLIVTFILLTQGQLFLSVITAWTAVDSIRADKFLMGKLAALIARIKS